MEKMAFFFSQAQQIQGLPQTAIHQDFPIDMSKATMYVEKSQEKQWLEAEQNRIIQSILVYKESVKELQQHILYTQTQLRF